MSAITCTTCNEYNQESLGVGMYRVLAHTVRAEVINMDVFMRAGGCGSRQGITSRHPRIRERGT